MPVLLLFAALGGLRYALSQPTWTMQDLPWYNNRGSYALVALVDKPPDRRENATYLHISTRELYDPASMTYRRVSGSALVRLSGGAHWQLGDLLRFTASPLTPSANEDFSYQAYLQRQGVYTVIYYPTSIQRLASGQASSLTLALEWLRQHASKAIFASFPQPESGLLAGILLGNDNDLPSDTAQAYRDTGTAHIIAISGFNMAILAVIFMALFTRVLNRYWAVILSSLALITYAAFVGASPSVVRAAIMAVMAFFGHLIGRKNSGLNALGLAGGLILLNNPLLLWDASFQLSFAATLGLVLFAAPLETHLERFLEKYFSEKTAHQFTGPVSEYFLFTLAAQVTTLPVIALQFKRISLTSLLANPLVLPAQPAILVAGGVVTIAGMVFPFLGKFLGALVWPLLVYSNRMVEWLDQIPFGSVSITGNLAVWISICLIGVLLMILLCDFFKKIFKKLAFFPWILILAATAALVWTAVLRQPDGKLHLALLRADDGTALFVQSPGGQTLLIDPGGSPNILASQLSQDISPWYFHLDAALLTRRDSVKSLTALNDRLPVNLAILAPPTYQVTDDLAALSLPASIKQKKLVDGEFIQLDNLLILQSVAADMNGTALLLTYGETRIFIPGGVDPSLFNPVRTTNLNRLAALILDDADVANLPADMWSNYGAQVILWNSTSLAPDPAWFGLDGLDKITIYSNGNGFWLTE